MSTPALVVENLSVRYGEGCAECADLDADHNRCPRCGTVYACRDVSFDAFAGEVVGIVGESGSGKSTVLACCNLDQRPTSGRIWLGGEDVTAVEGRRRRELRAVQLGIVYQSAQQGLDLGVTAGGNVAGRLLGAGSRSFRPIRARALELHRGMELPPDRFDVPVGLFSGGMRQRVQLARAMATAPPLLLLDEPTSGLDVSVQARILDLIRHVQRAGGMATVIVSHDLAVIRMLADHLLVMRRGRIVERGLTDQVLGDPHHPYSQLLVSSQLA